MESSKEGSAWDLDEYIVVADLYLRRGQTSNERDPEVRTLANLTGRSTGSISWRLANFQGTASAGERGAKAVRGDAATVFRVMQRKPAERKRLTAEATARLAAGEPPQPVDLPTRIAKLVEMERLKPTTATLQREAKEITVVRREARLVLDYVSWAKRANGELMSRSIPTDTSSLRVDIWDVPRNLLIEAKADSTRNNVRFAIGQLYDYRRSFGVRPRLAMLVPTRPSDDLVDLLGEAQVGVIWKHGKRFKEELI